MRQSNVYIPLLQVDATAVVAFGEWKDLEFIFEGIVIFKVGNIKDYFNIVTNAPISLIKYFTFYMDV